MKKIFSVLLLTAIIILVSGQEKVSAYDYYIGTYATGLKAYAMTETLHFESRATFQCRVKAANSSGKIVSYIDYWYDGGAGVRPTWSNSQGYSGYVDDGKGNISKKLYDYCQKVWFESIVDQRN